MSDFFPFFAIVLLSPLRSGIHPSLHLYLLVYQLYLVVLRVIPWLVVVLESLAMGVVGALFLFFPFLDRLVQNLLSPIRVGPRLVAH